MMPLLQAALTAAVCFSSSSVEPNEPHAATVAVTDTAYQRLFESGLTMEDFLASAKGRREQWLRNVGQAAVPDAVLATARSAPGPWRLLVVAVDGCSDSVNTVPYIAKLAQMLIGVELRIINSDVGRAIMNAHRTPDGRGATPTVILLDSSFEERGCWIERPSVLRTWMADNKGKVKDSDLFDHKMSWYDEDKGGQTIAEVAAMIEAAGRGEKRC